ncbi:MAG: serine/threonine-protein kinase [Acidobacteriota bacterium]
MKPERWQRIKVILDAARARPRDGRTVWLTEVCAGDDELRGEVESFLVHEERLDGFIEQPVVSFDSEGVDELPPGTTIGPYRLDRLLGKGGMGAVYLADRRKDFEQKVALKLVRSSFGGREALHRFYAERQILAWLDHPNIARLLDGGTTEDGVPYFVMEWVDGVPIDRYCDQERLTTRQRLELFLQVCAALQAAHQRLVVHRDLKPSNILVDTTGTPKLLDFGIAKLLDDRRNTETTAGVAMTPRYASPEQLQGEPIGTPSDVYSLGVVLYKVLAGRLPGDLENRRWVDIMVAICEHEPPPPSSVVTKGIEIGDEWLSAEAVSSVRDGDPRTLKRHLSGDVDAIVGKALRKKPRERYATVDRLADDIRHHLDGLPVLARQGDLRYRLGKLARRHRWALTSAAAVVLLVIGFTITLMIQLRITEQARDRAEQIVGFMIDQFHAAAPDQLGGEEPTVRDLLDQAHVALDTTFETEPEVRARLYVDMGTVYIELGDFTNASSVLDDAVGELRDLGRPYEPKLAHALNELASVHYKIGDLETSETLYRESIDIRLRLGLETDVIKPRNNLAAILMRRGKYEEAAELYQQSLNARRALPPGPRHEHNIATNLRSLSTAWIGMDDSARAEPLIYESLGYRRGLYGDDSVAVAKNLHLLAILEHRRGRFRAAELHFGETLRILRLELDPDHRDTALVERDYAALLLDLGAAETARMLLTRSLV